MTTPSLPGLFGIDVEGQPGPPVVPVPRTLRRYEFFVAGEPRAMGSKSAFVVPNGKGGFRAVVTDAGAHNKAAQGKLRSWKDSVIAAASDILRDGQRIQGPVRIDITFHLARPGGHWGKNGLRPSAPLFHAVKPDYDKLLRSTLDALTVVLIVDDSRVCKSCIEKVYATRETGALIVVEELG